MNHAQNTTKKNKGGKGVKESTKQNPTKHTKMRIQTKMHIDAGARTLSYGSVDLIMYRSFRNEAN